MTSDNHSKHRDPIEPNEPLRDHVFDGIQEFDKKLPNWWLFTLYGTIVFSIGYWFYFHIFDIGLMQDERLAREQARAEEWAAANLDADFSDERLLAMSADSEIVASGRAIYGASCAACHGADAEGGIGPNLKDGEWIHGGSPGEILHTILEGVPAKGMPGWQSALGSRQSAEVTAFILSLNPPASVASGEEFFAPE